MSDLLKYRLTGAIILVSLMVIFLPIFFDGAGYQDLAGMSEIRKEGSAPIVFKQQFPELSPQKTTTHYGIPVKDEPAPRAERINPYPSKRGKLTLDEPIQKPIKRKNKKAQSPGQWFVQGGVFSHKANADNFAQKVRKALAQKTIQRTEKKDKLTIHKVLIGPFGQAAAERVKSKLHDKLKIKGSIIK